MKGSLDLFSALIGLVLVVAVVGLVLQVIATVSESTRHAICKDCETTLAQKDVELAGLRNQTNYLQQELEIARAQYRDLAEQNITKLDFRNLQTNYTIVVNQVNTLQQKIDVLTQNFNSYALSFVLFGSLSIGITLISILDIALIAFGGEGLDLSRKLGLWLGRKKKPLSELLRTGAEELKHKLKSKTEKKQEP
ncbi:MAG: hypothetical protein WC792_04085 [Candidatus Micrarchaeia archaeon]|jgi:hypothetical protein